MEENEDVPGYYSECDGCPCRISSGDAGLIVYECTEETCIYEGDENDGT